VVDSTAPNLEEHRTTVLQVLQQIGVSEEKLQNMIEVWNKVKQFINSPYQKKLTKFDCLYQLNL
jgi:50S ribosomal subunit-associated GTPase HflX